MPTKFHQHSETTKREILLAAAKLFSQKGYQSVTIREIAKKAGCSHTTLYIYFKDKEALLHALSEPPLLALKQQMEEVLLPGNVQSEQKLHSICILFVRFCLKHRSMHRIFFETKSVRVDEPQPELEINKLRIDIFQLLKLALKDCLPPTIEDSALLSSSRIFSYMLRGIIGTYMDSEEPLDVLMERLTPTFNEAFDVLLAGFILKLRSE
ncbi:TetR/AcrR family transcriptional regulator [Sporolactobacillus laevolacticus]|uniref:Transcriptional regulator n=1 Tax=Sporolactobacillus laevolacticus DSM 442 TaxID=1395513 RepID=V6J4I3_9BACL|nr:TetR/AcrR family transcriptional regulator [Sporolactobacillus laevolacticus]EST11639.1 transcriptional regulator [Sporolactobacillus laevolacticus DSM 442]